MRRLNVLSDFNLKEIDNGYVLKIRPRSGRTHTGAWEVEMFIDNLNKAGQIFNVFLMSKVLPDEEKE